MTKAASPVNASAPRKPAGRRTTDPHVTATEQDTILAGTNLPVVAGPAHQHEEAPGGVVEAQILGQPGQKRGLRGGKPVLDQARAAYLDAEWSGSADRRLRRGALTKTEI